MTLLFYGALGAASYLLILQCELRLGYSAAQAGAALVPESLVFLVLAPASGALVARFGPRRLMTGRIVPRAPEAGCACPVPEPAVEPALEGNIRPVRNN